jgi:hypothetical protein
MLMVDEDVVERLLQQLEAEGHDMTQMREARTDLAALEVGDPTPLPGSLLREPTIILPTPRHEGLNEPPEGKFYLPPFDRATTMPRQVRRLNRRISRLAYWLLGLTMCCVSFAAVVAYRWNG